MVPTVSHCRVVRLVWLCVALSAAGLGSGCATRTSPTPVAANEPPRLLSPAPEIAPAGDAWRQAEAFAEATPGCEVLVGSGDSMLPLYPDRTVLVVRRLAIGELQAGITVIFAGEQGSRVAHTLIEKTPGGWIARGLGNAEVDRTRVRSENYLGTVIKAFAPTDRRARLAAAQEFCAAVEHSLQLARQGPKALVDLSR